MVWDIYSLGLFQEQMEIRFQAELESCDYIGTLVSVLKQIRPRTRLVWTRPPLRTLACLFQSTENQYVDWCGVTGRQNDTSLLALVSTVPGDHTHTILLSRYKPYEKTANVKIQFSFYREGPDCGRRPLFLKWLAQLF